MCDLNKIKNIINSDKSYEEQFDEIEGELIKNNILDNIDSVGISLEELGLVEEDFNTDFIYELTEDDFTETMNFDKDIIDEEFKVIKLYKYISNIYGPSGVGENTRDFCRRLVSRTNLSLMRKVDIQALNSSNPGFGKGGSDYYSVFNWRGGSNCNHQWRKFFYDPDTRNLVEAPNNQQPIQNKV